MDSHLKRETQSDFGKFLFCLNHRPNRVFTTVKRDIFNSYSNCPTDGNIKISDPIRNIDQFRTEIQLKKETLSSFSIMKNPTNNLGRDDLKREFLLLEKKNFEMIYQN